MAFYSHQLSFPLTLCCRTAPTPLSEASVTSESGAPGTGWVSIVADDKALYAALKEEMRTGDHSTVLGFGDPDKAAYNGRKIEAMFGMNRL